LNAMDDFDSLAFITSGLESLSFEDYYL